jgi:Reverse transcriptase (RNA-dependent DNA polymerase)
MKIYFQKAFDSILWDYLLEVLRVRGFPPLWIAWMHRQLISSISFLKINGHKGQSFYHRKGKDYAKATPYHHFSLSSLSLQLRTMMNNIRDDLVDLPMVKTTLLQFADDTAIVTPTHAKNIKLIMTTLDAFAQVSGLNINLKSSFLPRAIPLDLLPTVKFLLIYNSLSLPIQYLRLPLTIKKPPKSTYLPLLTNIKRRYEGFKGKKMSMAERSVLTNSMLNAVPLHYMQVFLLPKWVIKQITITTRRFLWRGTKDTSGGHCLVAWPKITLPKINGGLDIIDLKLQNKALLLKWIWLTDTDRQCLWTVMLHCLQLSFNPSYVENDNRLSFVMRDLATLQPF